MVISFALGIYFFSTRIYINYNKWTLDVRTGDHSADYPLRFCQTQPSRGGRSEIGWHPDATAYQPIADLPRLDLRVWKTLWIIDLNWNIMYRVCAAWLLVFIVSQIVRKRERELEKNINKFVHRMVNTGFISGYNNCAS